MDLIDVNKPIYQNALVSFDKFSFYSISALLDKNAVNLFAQTIARLAEAKLVILQKQSDLDDLWQKFLDQNQQELTQLSNVAKVELHLAFEKVLSR